MAKVPNGIETLRKITIAWVGCTNVTDDRRQQTDRQTTDRQTDGRRHIANMNMSSRSLKAKWLRQQFARYHRLLSLRLAIALHITLLRSTQCFTFHFEQSVFQQLFLKYFVFFFRCDTLVNLKKVSAVYATLWIWDEMRCDQCIWPCWSSAARPAHDDSHSHVLQYLYDTQYSDISTLIY